MADRHEPEEHTGGLHRAVSRRSLIKTSGVLTGGAVAARALWPTVATAAPGDLATVAPVYYPLASFTPQVDLHGLVVVVTGASRGIGRAAAEAFQAAGATVVGTSRDPKRVPNPPNYPLLTLDITSNESVDKFAKDLDKQIGRNTKLNILVNNAGRIVVGDFIPSGDSAEYWLAQNDLGIETVYRGHIRVTNKFLSRMSSGYARIMFTVSSYGYVSGGSPGDFASPFLTSYIAGKRALMNHANCLRTMLAPTNIGVQTVNPYAVHTGLAEHPHPIYTEPVNDQGLVDGPASLPVNQFLTFLRSSLDTALPPSFVGDSYAQLAQSLNPPPNVVVASQTPPYNIQGLNVYVEGQLRAENAISPLPFVSV